MAGMYSGQSASAKVDGIKKGYSFIDQAQTASQEAKLREERIKKAVTENKLLDIAYSDVAGPSEADQQLQQLQQKVQQQDKQLKASQGATIRTDLNEAVLPTNGKDRSKMIETLKARFKTNPDIYKSLGVQNAGTMSILNPRDQKDRTWMMSTLTRQGITPESQGLKSNSPEWQQIVDDAIDGYPAMKADGAVVDLAGLSVAMGSATMANPEHNDRMTKNWQELKGRLTRASNNTEKALSTEPGQPMPPLETVEQNQMISPTTGAEIGMQGAGQDNTQVDKVADSMQASQATTQAKKKEGRSKVKAMIGSIESNGNYAEGKNQHGYEGKYQFRYDNPNDAGYDIANKLGYTADEIRQDPKKQEEVMDVYLDQNATSLEAKGHEATPYNLWLAHNQGAGGANAIITGKLTPQIRKNIEAQGVEGNTDKELIANYHAKFAPKMGGEPSAVSTQVSSTITNEMNKQGGGQPLSDMRMRKVYALLGRSYPKDPNEPTAKIKEYEFLKGTVGEDKAFEAIFGEKTGSLSRLGKMIKERAMFPEGSKEYNEYSKKIEKEGRAGTASKFDFDTAREANKQLVAKGEANWDDTDRQDYQANLEVIQNYEKTVKEQNNEATYKENERADNLEIDIAEDLATFKKTGQPMGAKSEAKLKQVQDIRRKNNPESLPSDRKKLDEMNGKRRTANGLAKVINRLDGGDLEGLEKGVVDNAGNWITGIVGIGGDEGSRNKFQENARKAIQARTRLGIIQANYIKAMSGTAASDAERQFLLEIMSGGKWDDIESLNEAVKEFYHSTVEDLRDYHTEASPYEEYLAKKVDPIKSSGSSERNTDIKIGDTYKGKKVIRTGMKGTKKVILLEGETDPVEL